MNWDCWGRKRKGSGDKLKRGFFGEFFYFSRSEQRGIIVLAVLVAVVLCFNLFHDLPAEEPPAGDGSGQTDATQAPAGLLESTARSRSRKEGTSAGNYPLRKRADETPLHALRPEPFDPNLADSATFRRMGLPAWMARNILRYRDKGGRFRQAADFQKIYGLTEEAYRQLAPYIRIAPEEPKPTPRLYQPPTDTDSLEASLRTDYKYPEGTVVELNEADTTELQKIPGIGSMIARMIVTYRQRLGGFHRLEQLGEIHLDYHALTPWLRIDTTSLHRLNLNKASLRQMRNHPYLNFYQAKAIVEHRKRQGRLPNLKSLRLYEEFTEKDLERIAPYVCFE